MVHIEVIHNVTDCFYFLLPHCWLFFLSCQIQLDYTQHSLCLLKNFRYGYIWKKVIKCGENESPISYSSKRSFEAKRLSTRPQYWEKWQLKCPAYSFGFGYGLPKYALRKTISLSMVNKWIHFSFHFFTTLPNSSLENILKSQHFC